MYMYSHTDKFYTLYIDRNQFNMDKFIIKVINRTYIWLYMATTPRCIWKGFDKIHLTEKVITILEAEMAAIFYMYVAPLQQNNFNFLPILLPPHSNTW